MIDFKQWSEAEKMRHYQVKDGRVLCGASVPNYTIWLEPLGLSLDYRAGLTRGLRHKDCDDCIRLAQEAAEFAFAEEARLRDVLRERVLQKIAQLTVAPKAAQ